MAGCSKTPSTASGNNAVVYESDGYVDLMSNFEAFINKTTLYISDAKPYEAMIGTTIATAKKNTINGHGVAISNIVINNITASPIELTQVQNIDTLAKYLQNSNLVISYFSNAGVQQDLVIGTFQSINHFDNKVIYSPTGTDLTSFMENNPDKLFFTIQMNGRPSIPLKTKYYIGFNFNYSFDETELK